MNRVVHVEGIVAIHKLEIILINIREYYEIIFVAVIFSGKEQVLNKDFESYSDQDKSA